MHLTSDVAWKHFRGLFTGRSGHVHSVLKPVTGSIRMAVDLLGEPLPPSTPTTLDPPETSVDPSGIDLVWDRTKHAPRLLHCQRHEHWPKRRERVYRALLAADVSHSRAEAFRTCGTSWWVLRQKTDQNNYMLCPDHCHDRFCEPCQNARSRAIRSGLKGQLTASAYRFLTLTIRHSDQPLKEQLGKLYASFRRLRATRLWKSVVDGGIAFLELTRNVDHGQWHPHLHCILSGKWIPAAELAAAWKRATGDSHVIDVRLVRDKMQVVTYVAKYATKAYTHRDHYPQECLIEAIKALRGRRTVVTFGSQAPLKTAAPRAVGDWVCVCHANELGITDRIDDELATRLRAWIRLVDERRALPSATFTPGTPGQRSDDSGP